VASTIPPSLEVQTEERATGVHRLQPKLRVVADAITETEATAR
jgi:hypothetical protein